MSVLFKALSRSAEANRSARRESVLLRAAPAAGAAKRRSRSRRIMLLGVLGLFAVSLAGLSLLPQFWTPTLTAGSEFPPAGSAGRALAPREDPPALDAPPDAVGQAQVPAGDRPAGSPIVDNPVARNSLDAGLAAPALAALPAAALDVPPDPVAATLQPIEPLEPEDPFAPPPLVPARPAIPPPASPAAGGAGGDGLADRVAPEPPPREHPLPRRGLVVDAAPPPGVREQALRSAQQAMSRGAFATAVPIYQSILDDAPADGQAELGLAVALQRLGRAEQAMAVYRRLLDREPDNAAARSNYLGLVGRQNPQAAIEELQHLLRRDPHQPVVLAQMGMLQAGTGDTTNALRNLEEAVRLAPDEIAYVVNLAVLSDQLGRREDAIRYYREVLRLAELADAGAVPVAGIRDRLRYLYGN